MTKNISKGVLAAAAVLALICLAGLAYSRPGYFAGQTYLGGFIGLEVLIAALWRFRQTFFPLLMLVFLTAGAELPFSSIGTSGRWVFLGIGALVGVLITLKDRQFRLGFFHMVSFSCVLAALGSAAVSRYPSLAALKALSLFLLFLYAASGARIAVEGRENSFLEGLVTGCEILVGATAVCYAGGAEVLGNPNSLGALMGVVGAPVLLWGMLVSKDAFVRRRRLVFFLLAMYLVYYSHARAGMLAAVVSTALLCVGVREYKMFLKGFGLVVIMFAAGAILQPQTVSNSVSLLTSDVVYKGFQDRGGVLASRQSPWNEAMDEIHNHFWFGTGFGTKDTLYDSSVNTATYASNFARAEYGSSYLALVVYVGMIGSLPFALLLLMVLRKVIRTFRWMRATGSAFHPAVPLALIVVAGLVNAGLEDWLFAVGYYLCVFLWCMAFVLVDIAPIPFRAPSYSFHTRLNPFHSDRHVLVPGRG